MRSSQSSQQIGASLGQSERLRASTELLTPAILGEALQAISAQFDDADGGLGGAPKFPQPMIWEFVLRYWKRAQNPRARQMAHTTLTMMARGGMYDQVGGGFHRYSVDSALARAALREDALRQRPARLALPPRLAGARRSRVSPDLRGDARLHPARDDRPGRRLLLVAGRRLRGPRGQVLRLDPGRAARESWARPTPSTRAATGAWTAARTSRARASSTSRASRMPSGSRRSGRSSTRRGNGGSIRASTTRSWPRGTVSPAARSRRPAARSAAPTTSPPR